MKKNPASRAPHTHGARIICHGKWPGMAGDCPSYTTLHIGILPLTTTLRVLIHPRRLVAVRDYERKARSALRFFSQCSIDKREGSEIGIRKLLYIGY